MTIKKYAGDKITGLSSDTKPTNVPEGATFYELDTLKTYVRYSSSWQEMSANITPAFSQANLALSTAQSAFTKANTALANTDGVTFDGSLNVSANLTVLNKLIVGTDSEDQTYASSKLYVSGGTLKLDSNQLVLWDGSGPTHIYGVAGGNLYFSPGNGGAAVTMQYRQTDSDSNAGGALIVDGGAGLKGNVHSNGLWVRGLNVVQAIVSSYNAANGAPGIANSYADVVGTSANVYAASVGVGANSYATSVGTSGNAYALSTATSIGTSGNSYATAVGTSSNAYATNVGTAGNAFATLIGASANGWANTKVSSSGGTITGDLSIAGNLNVTGNTTFISATNFRVDDPLIYLASNNYVSDIVDIGFIANYVNATGANVHTGLYREHTDKTYYLFQGYDKEPANNHIGALSNNMTLAVLNADIRTSNLELFSANAQQFIISAFAAANAAPGISNSYATAVGAAGNTYAASVGVGANTYTTSVGTSGNSYALATATAIGTAGNSYATAVGTSGNAYALATATAIGTAGNSYTTAVGTAGNTYAASVGVGANAYATSVGTSANAYAATVGTGANSFTITTFNTANVALNTAQAAFARTNTALQNTTGTFAGALTVTGTITALGVGGDEGGEIQLANAVTNSTLSGSIVIDVYQNKLRFFEAGGSNRGAFIDLGIASSGVGSNLFAGGGSTEDTTARTTASAAFDKANAANITAGAAFDQANAAPGIANSYATAVGTSGNTYATAVGVAANSFSNTKLANTTGTFNGSLTIAGNTVISGNAVISRNPAALPAPPDTTLLQISGADGELTRFVIDAFASNPTISFRRAAGTAASPSAVGSGQVIGAITSFGRGATGYSSASRASISSVATENWSDSAQGTYWTFSTTAAGTTTLSERMRIDASGNVGIGITAPTSNLHVIGTVNVSQNLVVGGNLSASNVSVTGSYSINSNQLIVGTLGGSNTTILGANIVTGNVTVTNDILKGGLPYLMQRANVVIFTASGTYNPTINVEYALVIATGAGGTGGGSDTDGTAGAGATGGGAGGTAIRLYPYSEVNGATVTIGVRGAAGAATGTGGTTGGNTIFAAVGGGTTLFANGGSAGAGTGTIATAQGTVGQPGGSATGGQLNITGGSSHSGAGNDVGNIGVGGHGGASFWGGGGYGAATGVSAQDLTGGNAGLTTYGAGGGGGASVDSTTGAAGGFSANGVVFILEFTS